MNTLDTYKTALLVLQKQLTAELTTIAYYNQKTGDWEVRVDDVINTESDSNDVADFGEEADERIATLAELETRFRNVERALKKLENNTFGVCEIGGEQIKTERLKANPAARTCTAHLEQEADLPL